MEAVGASFSDLSSLRAYLSMDGVSALHAANSAASPPAAAASHAPGPPALRFLMSELALKRSCLACRTQRKGRQRDSFRHEAWTIAQSFACTVPRASCELRESGWQGRALRCLLGMGFTPLYPVDGFEVLQ